MSKQQFELLGGSLCLDFLNTIHEYGAVDPKEELHNLSDLIAFGTQTGAITQKEATVLSERARPIQLWQVKHLQWHENFDF